jgi:hypothetical protein
MTTTPSTIDKLAQFQERDLFSAAAWSARGLNPSGDHLCQELNIFFRSFAEALATALTAGQSKRQVKALFISAFGQLDKNRYDREEKEFIADLFAELAAIVNVDIRYQLNRWLYDAILAVLLALTRLIKPERVVKTLQQPCRQCGTSLETQVLRKDNDIPDYQWLVARCNHCGELNLLSLEPGIRKLHFNNYQRVDVLLKTDYTQEQAQIRLEQIKYFRK